MDLPPILVTGAKWLLTIGCLAGGIILLRAKTSPQSIQKAVVVSDPAMCLQVMAGKGYNNTEAENRYTDVHSRAVPNQRLVRAFVIDNSFTTSHDKRRKEFNAEAIKAMKMTDAKVSKPSQKKVSPVPQASMCIPSVALHFWSMS